MSTDSFKLKSRVVQTSGAAEEVVQLGTSNGLIWSWKYAKDSPVVGDRCQHLYFAWKLEGDLENVDGFEGRLVVYENDSFLVDFSFKANNNEWFERKVKRVRAPDTSKSSTSALMLRTPYSQKILRVPNRSDNQYAQSSPSSSSSFSFTLNVKPIKTLELYTDNFCCSELTDAVLVVEEQRLHVTKQMLARHSEYFHKLFYADFKEKSQKEIEINEVSYKDFALLLSMILPNPQFVTEENAELLYELADRFQMTSVTAQVAHFMTTYSTTRLVRMTHFADKHSLGSLLDRCIRMISSNEHVRSFKTSPLFGELSEPTKVRILWKMWELCKCHE